MEFRYKIITINKVDQSQHTVCVGLKEKDALKMFRNLIMGQDPNEPIMYAMDKYLPMPALVYGGNKEA